MDIGHTLHICIWLGFFRMSIAVGWCMVGWCTVVWLFVHTYQRIIMPWHIILAECYFTRSCVCVCVRVCECLCGQEIENSKCRIGSEHSESNTICSFCFVCLFASEVEAVRMTGFQYNRRTAIGHTIDAQLTLTHTHTAKWRKNIWILFVQSSDGWLRIPKMEK